MAKTELGIDDKMTFGKYKGKEIGEIIDDDPSYLEWAVQNTHLELDTQASDLLTRELRAR